MRSCLRSNQQCTRTSRTMRLLHAAAYITHHSYLQYRIGTQYQQRTTARSFAVSNLIIMKCRRRKHCACALVVVVRERCAGQIIIYSFFLNEIIKNAHTHTPVGGSARTSRRTSVTLHRCGETMLCIMHIFMTTTTTT